MSSLRELFSQATAIVQEQAIAVRATAVLLVGSAVSAGLLIQHFTWYMLPLVGVLLAFFTYHSAVSAAVEFGVAVEAAFDLFRFELHTAMRLPLPSNQVEEVAANEKLCDLLRQDLDQDLIYKD